MPPLTPHIEKGYAGGRQSRQQEASADPSDFGLHYSQFSLESKCAF
jgi:hypothetical protein